MTQAPVELYHPDRTSRIVICCDHATNHVPDAVGGGNLGVSESDMARHIAFDPGAAGVTRALADALNAPAVLSNFSRLVIDPNRGEDDPTLLMRLYDGTIIPGNRHADDAEIARRKSLCYDPYHAALSAALAGRPEAILVSVHSFTPQLNGRSPRPWHIGILSAYDRRLSDPLIARLRQESDLCVGDNAPYSGHLEGDVVDKHALRSGRLNTLIELRQDLISTADAQIAWGKRLAPMIAGAIHDVEEQAHG